MDTIARGDGSKIVEPRQAIVRDEREWRALWLAHAGLELPVPAVDFETRMVAAVFAGERPTPGFTIEVTATRRDGMALALLVKEGHPEAGLAAAQLVVTPFHIVSLPRYDGDVRFADADAPSLARPSQPRRMRASARDKSTTGLSPEVAAALAYLAGPFSGVLVLLSERTSRFVRFHAWQAIVGLGGLAALAVGLLACAFLALLVSPALFTWMYRLSAVAVVVWLVAWGVCLVKALTGRVWRLPLVGAYAERKANP
jgi:uncharacterized membrane protein